MTSKKPKGKANALGVFQGPASARTRPPEGKKVKGIGKFGQGARKPGSTGQPGGPR